LMTVENDTLGRDRPFTFYERTDWAEKNKLGP
jgi:hypothetical protein